VSRIANDSMACCEEEADGMGSIAPNRPSVLMHNATREENARFHEYSPQPGYY
jgi:hypothetical protein